MDSRRSNRPISPNSPPTFRHLLNSLYAPCTTSAGDEVSTSLLSSHMKLPPPAPQITLRGTKTPLTTPLKVELNQQDPAIMASRSRPTPSLPGLLQLPGTYTQAPRPPIHPAPPSTLAPNPLLKFSFAASKVTPTPRTAVYSLPLDSQIVVTYDQDSQAEKEDSFLIATGWLWSTAPQLSPYWTSDV